MRKDAITSLLAVVVLTVLLGLVYPLVVTGVSQVAMPGRANGSLIERGGKTVGSRLIGQDFRRPVTNPDGSAKEDADGNPVLAADPRYFQSRPSVTGSSGNATFFSNRGPNSTDTKDAIDANVAAYLALERPYDRGLTAAGIPVDAVTDSASGVDPGISEENARIQARRVAAVRRLPLGRVLRAVEDHTDGRGLGVLGEPAVNVLELNLALDALQGGSATASSDTTRSGQVAAPGGPDDTTSTATPNTEGTR